MCRVVCRIIGIALSGLLLLASVGAALAETVPRRGR